MKKNLLFIFLLVVFIIPSQVKGAAIYVNHGEYEYSDVYIEEQNDLEVEEIIENGKTIYKYRTRDYLIVDAGSIIIRSRDFNVWDYIETSLPLEKITLTEKYDLKEMNNCYSSFRVTYNGSFIGKLVYINIENYIEVPEEIVVTDYNFDIWEYVETDIEVIDDIKFTGEYDLYKNGEYELMINYNDISKQVKIIVDIEENEQEEEGKLEETEDNEIDNNIIEEDKEVEELTNTYISNYYQTYESSCEEKIEYVDRIVPVNNKVNCKDTDYNKQFRYISYAFYGATTILLSIIVVRKK